MKKIIFFFILFCIALPALSVSFLPGAEDIPLIKGLIIYPPTIFDSPVGRFVDVQAKRLISVKKIKNFYDQTLPQLGWQLTKQPMIYVRSHEKLTIQLHNQKQSLLLDFILEPR